MGKGRKRFNKGKQILQRNAHFKAWKPEHSMFSCAPNAMHTGGGTPGPYDLDKQVMSQYAFTEDLHIAVHDIGMENVPREAFLPRGWPS